MTTYTIETGIPAPKPKNNSGLGERRILKTALTRILDELAPGQSVLTTEYTDRVAAYQFKLRRPDRVFTIRKLSGQGWRIWRLE